ncbi:hypothetical protein N0V82_007217 [Gnomoniopsis sp. IMI 355080]|nr:hypothetical protein N0V82_007217 [Gnomoniopsis sp. IMI 355080]
MPAPKTLPKYVYKIIDLEPPSPIPIIFPPSELDQADGFIHLSTASQIRYEPISSISKWDDPPNDNDGCPHLYGSFGAAETDSVEKFERTSAEQEWKDVFAASSWLE